MKRRISTLLGAAALTLALAGCGSDSTAATTAATTAAETTAAETTAEETTTAAEETTAAQATDAVSSATMNEAATRALDQVLAEVDEIVYENEEGQLVVSHKYGETVVPENPERVVCIKLEDLMLAMDADMVACRNFDDFYLNEEIKALGIGEIAVDEEANTVNFEQVLSYNPDLIIIRDSFDQTIYDELSKIAPTVAFRIQNTRVSLIGMGRILGIEDQAIARLGQFERKILDAKEALEAVAGEQAAMVRVLKKEIRLYPYSKNDMSNFLFLDLGLTPDPMVVEYDSADNLAISMEMLPELTAEHIFLVAGYGSQTDEADIEAKKSYETIKADPLWQMVPAVQEGNVYEVDSRVWLTYGILATEMKIDDVLASMLSEN